MFFLKKRKKSKIPEFIFLVLSGYEPEKKRRRRREKIMTLVSKFIDILT